MQHVPLIPFSSCVRYYMASVGATCGIHTYVHAADELKGREPERRQTKDTHQHVPKRTWCVVCSSLYNIYSSVASFLGAWRAHSCFSINRIFCREYVRYNPSGFELPVGNISPVYLAQGERIAAAAKQH